MSQQLRCDLEHYRASAERIIHELASTPPESLALGGHGARLRADLAVWTRLAEELEVYLAPAEDTSLF